MITEIIELNNSKIFRTMKTFFYFTPIGIIVFQFLKNYYPDLDFYLSSDISTIDVKYTIVYFFTLTLSTFLIFFLHKILLPIFLGKIKPFKKSIKLEESFKSKITGNYKEQIFEELNNISPKSEIYDLLTYLSVTFILWLLCVQNIIVILPIIFIMIVTYFFAKLLNTLLITK